MRKAIEAAKKANDKAIQAAKKRADDKSRAAEEEAEKAAERAQVNRESQLAAMQRDFERLPLLRQVYYEAPDDVFELIVSKCKDWDEQGWGRGGLNAFRLANKRCKQVVESCTTVLTNHQEEDGPESLPIPVIQKCRRIEEIGCLSHNLRNLEGCPDGLKDLLIGDAPHLSDLSPLASCSMMRNLVISDSSITDISVLSSMPLLKKFASQKRDEERPSIKDLTPLSSCQMLAYLYLHGNRELKDLSPLSVCTALEDIEVTLCPLITSLAPLSSLKMLKQLWCAAIDSQTSLLPLESCPGLKELSCDANAVDLEELRRKRPDLKVNLPQLQPEE